MYLYLEWLLSGEVRPAIVTRRCVSTLPPWDWPFSLQIWSRRIVDTYDLYLWNFANQMNFTKNVPVERMLELANPFRRVIRVSPCVVCWCCRIIWNCNLVYPNFDRHSFWEIIIQQPTTDWPIRQGREPLLQYSAIRRCFWPSFVRRAGFMVSTRMF